MALGNKSINGPARVGAWEVGREASASWLGFVTGLDCSCRGGTRSRSRTKRALEPLLSLPVRLDQSNSNPLPLANQKKMQQAASFGTSRLPHRVIVQGRLLWGPAQLKCS